MSKKALKSTQVKTPELKRMLAVKADSQRIGEFLEWLSEQGIWLAKPDALGDLYSIRRSRETLLAEYFEIDLDKCEAERRALLDDTDKR